MAASAALLVCRHSDQDVLGVSYDPASEAVVVTVRRDGIACYSAAQQKRLVRYPLGTSGRTEFQAAAVQHGTLVAAAVHDAAGAGGGSALACFPAGGSQGQFRTVSDVSPRVILPAPAHSCHILQHAGAAAAGSTGGGQRVAVVLNDGRVGCAPQDGAVALELLQPSQPAHQAPRAVLAASSGDTLVVVTQAQAGDAVSLRVLRPAAGSSGSATSLAVAKATTVQAPSKHAMPCGLTLSPAFALLQWSNGCATAVHGLQGSPAAALKPATFTILAAAEGTGAGASTSTPSAPASAGRKRRTPAAADAAPAGAEAPRVLCAAVDSGQFLVIDLEAGASRSQLVCSLRDAHFGCPLASSTLDVDAPLLSLPAASCSVVHCDPDRAVVRLSGAVHVLHLRAQPVSLLSLVARLSLSNTNTASGAPPLPDAAGSGVPLARLPAPVTIAPALLAAPGDAGVLATDGAADTLMQPVPPGALVRLDDTCNQLVSQLAAAAAQQQPPAKALLDSCVSYVSGCREHGVGLPPQLPSLLASGLVRAGAWPQLASLLSQLEPGSLTGCGEVLPAVAAAQQYSLLPRLATVMDDVAPGQLVEALQHLLAPTTRANADARRRQHASLRAVAEALVADMEAALAPPGGSQQAAAVPPSNGGQRRSSRHAGADGAGAGNLQLQQQQQHQHQHQHGAAGGLGLPSPAAHGNLALAQCAAAAVDGFSYREVLLHPLLAMPVDSVGVQAALRRLSGLQADALLGYLAKWVAKYAGGALGEAASGVVLPQQLLFPYFHQVLEWTRITIDAHLTRLLMAPSPLPAVEQLEASLGSAVGAAHKLMLLRGAAEHVSAHAPLPAAHVAVATQYTVQLLDLSCAAGAP